MGLAGFEISKSEDEMKAIRVWQFDHVILYQRQNFVEETMRITNGHGADLIIDGVGGSTIEGDLEAAALRGHVVVYGEAGGIAKPVGPYELQKRSLTVSGALLTHFVQTRSELLARSDAVIAGIRAGWLRLRTEHLLPLEAAADAHRLLEGRQSIGKIILRT
jgi:NADPH2:quinone reductase